MQHDFNIRLCNNKQMLQHDVLFQMYLKCYITLEMLQYSVI